MKVLHLDSSIQEENSASRSISAAIIHRLRSSHALAEVIYRDLCAEPLPHLTLPGLLSSEARETLGQFLAADVVVIGAPMYNFGIPSQLKSWFDHILIAGKTFRYGESGAEGLVGNKRVIVALARGGIYSQGPSATMEHAETHLRALLGFIGIKEPEFIIAEGVAIDADMRQKSVSAAVAEAARLEFMPPAV